MSATLIRSVNSPYSYLINLTLATISQNNSNILEKVPPNFIAHKYPVLSDRKINFNNPIFHSL